MNIKWISVKDKKEKIPEKILLMILVNGKRVIGVYENSLFDYYTWIDDFEVRFPTFQEMDDYIQKHTTHWMNLPSAPDRWVDDD